MISVLIAGIEKMNMVQMVPVAIMISVLVWLNMIHIDLK